jgi:hypothetical protein
MPTVGLSCILGLFTVAGEAQQVPFSTLASTVRTGDYVGEVYTRRGEDGQFVFFVDEPIKILVSIGNSGREEMGFRVPGANPEEMFVVVALRNRAATDVGLTFQNGRLLGNVETPFNGRELTTLRPGERVEWMAEVSGPLLPGMYAISINTRATDERGRPIAPLATTYRYEVRGTSAESLPEIHRRAAMRHLQAGDQVDLAAADAAVERLLEVHPTSFEAYVIRGRIERRRGNETAALRSFARAAEIQKRR